MFTLDLSNKSPEEKLEERIKYKSFFSTERELELFLRLPINSDKSRRDYLNRIITAHVEEQKEKESKTEQVEKKEDAEQPEADSDPTV